jgi:SAM-dependent methyltransferase
VGARVSSADVVWHDLECGAYRADLPLWRQLAEAAGEPILEIGAGTGRVALDLARRGHSVIALERDRALAAELGRRAAELPVEVVCADACHFELDRAAALCIAPMQTVQLLDDRPGFLRCARAALAPGGVLAIALLGDDVQPFELELSPDIVELDGVRYLSAPTALRETADSVVLERRRTARGAGREQVTLDVIALARLHPKTLTSEALAAGFAARGAITIGPTDAHTGSVVVVFEAPAK